MGQRHQIYVRLPKRDLGKDNPNTRGEITIGIHHQWLYGRTALKLLKQYLSFIAIDQKENGADSFSRHYEATEKLAACYSLIAEEAYYHGVYQFTEADSDVLNDPRKGDNNDGITVIDLTKETPTYCFMSLHHIEAEAGEKCPNLKPLTAEEYVTYYYPHWREGKITERGNDGRNLIDAPELTIEIADLIKFFNNYKTTTLARVKSIFPDMFKKEK